MKIQMNDILALCFLVMLFLSDAVGKVGHMKCLRCINVGPDNKCLHKTRDCIMRKWRFCFIQKFSRVGKIVKITRGCIASCKNGTRISWTYTVTSWCCSRDHCNSMNVWY